MGYERTEIRWDIGAYNSLPVSLAVTFVSSKNYKATKFYLQTFDEYTSLPRCNDEQHRSFNC